MPCKLELIGLNGPTVWLMGVQHFGPVAGHTRTACLRAAHRQADPSHRRASLNRRKPTSCRVLPARGPVPLVPEQPNGGKMTVRHRLTDSDKAESEEIRPAVGHNRCQKPHWRGSLCCWNSAEGALILPIRFEWISAGVQSKVEILGG